MTVDVGTALAALALLGVLQNIDVVLLGRAAPGNAGPYAAISVATKLLVLAALVLSSFLLPEAAARRHLGQHALHQLGATLAILAVPAALLMTVSFLAPRQLLGLAFGGRLTAAAPAFADTGRRDVVPGDDRAVHPLPAGRGTPPDRAPAARRRRRDRRC